MQCMFLSSLLCVDCVGCDLCAFAKVVVMSVFGGFMIDYSYRYISCNNKKKRSRFVAYSAQIFVAKLTMSSSQQLPRDTVSR